MLVEPASLCWLAGRKAEARDGATWATELERWSALTAVVRDGGTGLSKGIELVRARRREPEGADLEDGLDVFHTPREGGPRLTSDLGRGEPCPGTGRGGAAAVRSAGPPGAVQQRLRGAVEAAVGRRRARLRAGRGGRSGLGPGPLGAGAVHARGPAQ